MKQMYQSRNLAVEDRDTKKQRVVRRRTYDIWLMLTVFVASAVSIGAAAYYFGKGETLLYNDAYAHLLNARIVIDSLTPGFSQLSNVWLPLQHILILPFIWNDYLWRTGLAGTIPSMISYVVAATYLFCALRRLTKQAATSLLGVAIFLFNPNILYLQSTPLPEVMYTAAFVATTYYLLYWLQSDKQKHLVSTAIATAVSTLIRFDGWALFLIVGAIVITIMLTRKHNRDVITDQFMIYLSIAPLGIISWLIWDKRMTGDPLYFQHSQYSAQAQQLSFLQRGQLPTYHNMMFSLRVYGIDVGQTIGWWFFACASLALIILLIVYRKRRECFMLVLMVIPFAFYVITLYSGSSIIQLPGAGNTTFFNVRYGAQMVMPEALLIGWGGALLCSCLRRWDTKAIFITACLICISAQIIDINTSGIVALQDGLVGRGCINVKQPVILSLSQHYNGGRILVDNYTSDINPQLFNAHFSSIIYEGSGSYWTNALAQPAKFVDWVVVNPYNSSDIVSRLLTEDSRAFLASFKLVSSNVDGLQLYYRIGAPPLPTRPIPSDLLNRPYTCKTYDTTAKLAGKGV